MNKPMISRDASERLAVEMFSLPMNSYEEICFKIASVFGLSCRGELITNGMDVIINDFSSPEFIVEMAWDNWSGFVVTAKTRESETLIHDIHEWLSLLEIPSHQDKRTKG